MRIMPFMKRKKGIQFAGVGLDTGGGGGGTYVLPSATSETLGGIKVGSGLSVTSDGTLSTSGGGGGSGVTFSTTEFETPDTWINGKKIFGIVYTNIATNVSPSPKLPSDFGTLVKYEGVASRQGYGSFTINNGIDTNFQAVVRVDTANKVLIVGGQSGNVVNNLIIYYTKED